MSTILFKNGFSFDLGVPDYPRRTTNGVNEWLQVTAALEAIWKGENLCIVSLQDQKTLEQKWNRYLSYMGSPDRFLFEPKGENQFVVSLVSSNES